MKLYDYIRSASIPPVYTPGTATMWDDEHISQQLLAVHLNPDIDLASRKPATILSTPALLRAGASFMHALNSFI